MENKYETFIVFQRCDAFPYDKTCATSRSNVLSPPSVQEVQSRTKSETSAKRLGLQVNQGESVTFQGRRSRHNLGVTEKKIVC
jgi:hypothetical protein